MKNIFYLIFLVLLACNNNTSSKAHEETTVHQEYCDTSSVDGILIIKADSVFLAKYTMDILNEDGSLYGQIVTSDQEEPNLTKLKGNIRAYYQDYYVIHFDAVKKNDSIFCVRIGNEMKIIRSNDFLVFLSWPAYIMKFYCTTDSSNPLRTSPEDAAAVVKVDDYSELSFTCSEVKGDWVKVKCFAACEGCPENNTSIAGWIRWRKNGVLILKQHYAC